MTKSIDKSEMVLSQDIMDDDPEELALLRERAEEACLYLSSFEWCKKVKRQWFAGGFSHIAVFFFEIDNFYPEDGNLWVIVGDIPPAHLVVDAIPDYKEALLVYAYEMRKWVDAVKNGRSIKRIIPVNVEPSMEYALMLESRLDFIEKNYVPSLE